MNDQGEFLRAVVLPLEAAGIPYMVTGSMASSFHGEPRATHDIDIVIAPRPSQLEMLLRALDMTRWAWRGCKGRIWIWPIWITGRRSST